MADTRSVDTEKKKKSSKALILSSLILGLIGLGGGFYLSYGGLISAAADSNEKSGEERSQVAIAMEDIGYVAIDPLTISLGLNSGHHLRFRAQLEIQEEHRSDVEKVLPRIIDVLNSYLRALSIDDIDKTASLVWIRAQMLRRIQVITGTDSVRDLLVMEFVVN